MGQRHEANREVPIAREEPAGLPQPGDVAVDDPASLVPQELMSMLMRSDVLDFDSAHASWRAKAEYVLVAAQLALLLGACHRMLAGKPLTTRNAVRLT